MQHNKSNFIWLILLIVIFFITQLPVRNLAVAPTTKSVYLTAGLRWTEDIHKKKKDKNHHGTGVTEPALLTLLGVGLASSAVYLVVRKRKKNAE